MLSPQFINNLKRHFRGTVCSRNLGVFAPVMQKATDPIQQLFVDKVREYNQKSSGGKQLVEASPNLQRELKSELEKAAKQYGAEGGADITKFPTFKFTDPVIDPISLENK